MKLAFFLSALLPNGLILPLILALLVLISGVWYGWLRTFWVWRKLKGQFSWEQVNTAFRSPASLKPNLNEILYFSQEPTAFSHRNWIILGPEGIGKSHLLIKAFAKGLLSPTKKALPISLISAQHMRPQALTEQFPNPQDCLLLIDGLDETPAFQHNPRQILDLWVEATSTFGGVIFSFDPANLQDIQIPTGSKWRFTGYQTSALFGIRRLPGPSKKQIAKNQNGTLRPLSKLSLAETAFDRLQSLRELWDKHSAELAKHQAFWAELLPALALHSKTHNALSIPFSTLHDGLQSHFGPLPEKKLSSLYTPFFWVDSNECARPLHPAWLVAAALYAWEDLDRSQQKDLLEVLPGLVSSIQALRLYEVDQSVESAVTVQTQDSPLFRPLSELAHIEVMDIRRISFSSLPAVESHWKVIALLADLEGIYLPDEGNDFIPNGLIQSLPSDHTLIYLGSAEKGWKAFQYASAEVDVWQKEEALTIEVAAKTMSPLDLAEKVNPLLTRSNPWNSPKKPGIPNFWSREILDWIQQIATYKNPKPKLEERLHFALNGLFHEISLQRLSSHSCSLQLFQRYDSTLLIQEVSDLLTSLSMHLGEDDHGKSVLTTSDEVQIQQGHWMGRSWLWERTDRYRFPVYLYMEAPQQLRMVIWNLGLPTQSVHAADQPEQLSEGW